jgi:uncharacterized damage-inducible protein DinB
MLQDDVIKNGRKTAAILNAIVNGVDQTAATATRDGDDGWTTLEVLCHLRDYELIWQERVGLTVREENPQLPGFDVAGLVTRNDYINQDFAEILAERNALRADSLALLATFDEATLQRTGVHPSRGVMTLLAQAQQLTNHDVDHIEQIVRILGQA